MPQALTAESQPALSGQVPHDGLFDEQGPIPAFGPARLDANGRFDMSDEEWEARRQASRRALKVIAEITDETDTDEVWNDVIRGLEGAR